MAMAPARQVVAAATLDSGPEPSTFLLSEISTADVVRQTPPGSEDFETTVPTAEDGDLESGAVDVLLDSAGLWQRRPAPSDLSATVALNPHLRFSLITNPVTRSNPPRKTS